MLSYFNRLSVEMGKVGVGCMEHETKS